MENSPLLHLTSMKCLIIGFLALASCNFSDRPLWDDSVNEPGHSFVDHNGFTIAERFHPPPDFNRSLNEKNSFAAYLRELPVYKAGKKVELYNGSLKGNQTAQAAVIKMDVGKQDLQQCADAVMRLRAEYLFKQKKYNALHFNFTNGFNAKYSTWRSGKGIAVKGNRVSWVPSSKSNGSYESFRKYMNKVFMYAGTASLEKELTSKELKDIKSGDVFIKGGHPGHAVIVVDVAKDEQGDKIFMLAQSYMPAQEIHILKNPNNQSLSPWYKVSEIQNTIETPEWTFYSGQVKSF